MNQTEKLYYTFCNENAIGHETLQQSGTCFSLAHLMVELLENVRNTTATEKRILEDWRNKRQYWKVKVSFIVARSAGNPTYF